MAAILNSAILHSTILHKKNFTHSFWLNLMMAAILNSAILHSTILHKTLTQSNSIWLTHSFSQLDDGSHLELCHLGFTHFVQNSDSNYFNLPQTHSFSHNLMMVTILNSANLNSAILDSTILHKKTSLIHSDSTWWWNPSSIWPSWIQPS